MMLRAMNNWQLVLIVLSLLCVQPLLAADEDEESKEFPGRPLYPEVSVIELDELYRRLDEVIVVDVRSAYEYETLRIKGAINVPLSSKTFVSRLRQLRMSDPRPIVVYCNGKTCMKSYKAARKCAVNKIDNVHSYDAGVMDWARTYPEHAELLGKSPVDPKRLISKKEFKKHLLSPDAYGEEVANSSAILSCWTCVTGSSGKRFLFLLAASVAPTWMIKRNSIAILTELSAKEKHCWCMMLQVNRCSGCNIIWKTRG